MSKQKKNMAKETFLYLPAKLLEGFIGIFTISCYTALFELDAYGDYLILNTSVIFIALVLTGWLTNSTTRFIGDDTSIDGIKNFLGTVLTLWGSISILLFVVLALVGKIISGFGINNGEFAHKFEFYLFLGILFVSYSLFQILSAALVQLKKIKLSIILSLTSAILKLGIAYGAFYVVTDISHSPLPAILAAFFSDISVSIVALIALHPKLFRRVDKSMSMQFFNYGMPLLGVTASIGLLNMVDRFIIKGVSTSAALAVYNTNYTISSTVFTLVMAAIMRGVYPSILAGFRQGGKTETLPLLNYGTRMYVLIALPAALGLAGVSPALSHLMFVRPEYAEGIPVIGLVAAGMFFMGLTEYANKAWELNRNTFPIFQNSAIAAIIKFVVSIYLIKVVGVNGAAIGTLIAFMSYFFITILRVKREFVFILSLKTWISVTVAAGLCGVTALAICTFSPLPTLINLCFAVIGGGCVYVGILILSGEIRHELSQIKTRLKKS